VTEARRFWVSKDQPARNKLLPVALIEDRNGQFDRLLAAGALSVGSTVLRWDDHQRA